MFFYHRSYGFWSTILWLAAQANQDRKQGERIWTLFVFLLKNWFTSDMTFENAQRVHSLQFTAGRFKKTCPEDVSMIILL